MGYHRVNITISHTLWTATRAYLQTQDRTFSRLVQDLLTEHLTSGPGREGYGYISEGRMREIIREEMSGCIPQAPAVLHEEPPESPPLSPVSPGYGSDRYPDPKGLVDQLNKWLTENHITSRQFKDRYGFAISNKTRWSQGGGLTNETARRILAIISDPNGL